MNGDLIDGWVRSMSYYLQRVPADLRLRVLHRLIAKLDPAPKQPRRKKSVGTHAPTDQRAITEAQRLLFEIRPILAQQHPLVVGSTLASLVSLWLAGIQPDQRDAFWRELQRLVDSSVDDCVALNITRGNLPPSWRDH